MPMRRDSISVRHLQTYGVIAVKSERITLHHGKLRSRKQKRRSGTIFDLVRCKRLFFCRSRSGNRYIGAELEDAADRCERYQEQTKIPFHTSSIFFFSLLDD